MTKLFVVFIFLLSIFPRTYASNTVVQVETVLGLFYIEMLSDAAPATVNNFLNYVNDGDYDGMFFHRSVPGFIVQTGGYKYISDSGVESLLADAPVNNEYNVSNTRGTVAMAKLGSDPDSATNQWFVNLVDNSENLDNQNGGFTVFGRVLNDGMQLLDQIAELPRVNFGSPFNATPTIDFDGVINEDIFVVVNRVRVLNPSPANLLMRNTDTGIWFSYFLDGNEVRTKGRLPLRKNIGWSLQGKADFSGDEVNDVLLRNINTGLWRLYSVDGFEVSDGGRVRAPINLAWKLQATEDFNGDGRADLLLRHQTTGRWRVYYLNGADIVGSGIISATRNLNWEYQSSGDFNNDGKADLLVRHNSRGKWRLYELDDLRVLTSSLIDVPSGRNWQLQASQDFNGDGSSDVLLRHGLTGRWKMSFFGDNYNITTVRVAAKRGIGWQFESADDFDDDGNPDLLIRNQIRGNWYLYTLEGNEILDESTVAITRNRVWVLQ